MENYNIFFGKICAINKTEVEVVFSKEVDTVSKENFQIEGATIAGATLASDKKTVTLQVSGLVYDKEYTLNINNILVNGEVQQVESTNFTTPKVSELYSLELSTNAEDNKILANGADNAVITAKLIDETTGKVDENADNIVLAFSATYGNLANTRVTVQDGVASVTFTSEFSQKDLVSKIDAQIIEASGDYKGLIGTAMGTVNVFLVTSESDLDPDQKPALVSAESNQADRVTLNFNKEVTPADFVVVNDATDKFEVDGSGNAELIASDIVEITQDNGTAKAIRGFKPIAGNPKSIEVILQNSDVLEDNKPVSVEVNMPSNVGTQTTSANFILTDARKPEATLVFVEGLKTVKVKFSESIGDANVRLDGGLTSIHSVVVGDFNQVTLEDNTDVLIITTDDYLKAGVHSVQLSSVYDFAGYTDPKNISTSQSLDFTVAADDSVPTADVTVESPEQFRINFNKKVDGFGLEDVELQRYNGEEWQVANQTNFDKLTSKPEFTMDTISASEYVLELTEDWTVLYDTINTNRNYYNDEYRIVIAEGGVENPVNGKENAKIVLPLDGAIMESEDGDSPVIADFEATDVVNEYNVIMTEPVKLLDKDENNTPSQLQNGSIPKTIIEFIGKDENSDKLTIPGKVNDYVDENGADMMFSVSPAEGYSLQDLVDNGANQNWKLYVRAISDDVGNTSSSLNHDFTIEPNEQGAEVFMVYGMIDGTPYNGVEGDLSDDTEDVILLTFTSGVQYTGTFKNAVNPSNYFIDGENLPKGTLIEVVDDNNDDNEYRQVRIILPDGTLSATHNNVITVSKSLESYKGTKLTGDYEISFKAIETVIDKSALTSAITDAETNRDSVTVSTDGTDVAPTEEWVTQADVDTYQAAINAAQAVVDNTSATQTEVDDAVTDLASATSTFDGAKQAGTLVDKSALTSAITDAETNRDSVTVSTDGTDVSTTEEWVTQADVDTYQAAINAAQAVVDNTSATQTEVDDAVTDLASATSTFDGAKQAGTM